MEAAPASCTVAPSSSRLLVRACQGRRAFTTDSRGGLSQWHGGRLGRHVSWDGPGTTAAATPGDAIDLCSNTWMTGVSCRRAPASGSPNTSPATRSCGRHASVRHAHHGDLRRRRKPGQRWGITARRLRELERPAGSIETGAATAYDPIIGASQVRSTYSVHGTGMTVAVIDTGVDYNNPALGGGFGPGDKVIAGFDFADNTANPMATTSQHGTAIAGLIGSDDPNDLGVAPGVNIVALRVTDSTNTASLTSVANALQWVINNHSQYNITAVNMSLSDGGNYAQNWFANDGGDGQQVTQLIGQLTAMNIPVIAATGNSFTGQQGEGFAAIVAGTISVTATDLSGNLLVQRPAAGLGDRRRIGHDDRRPGRGLDRSHRRLGNVHGRRNQLRHGARHWRRDVAPGDLPVAVRSSAHGRPDQGLDPAVRHADP